MKKIFLYLSFLIISWHAYSEKIPVAEIIVYDEEGNIVSNHASLNKDLCKQLSKKWFDGCIEFSPVSQSKIGAVTSSFDAMKACNLIDSQYVVYGYLKKTSVNYYCELKLYNKEISRIQKTFFSTDDLDNYDRLILDIAGKIENFFIDSFGIKTAYDETDNLHPLELAFPISTYYWTPMNADWSKVLMGIIGINAGIEIYPSFPMKYLKNRKFDISLRFLLDYRYGTGTPNSYSLNYHAISIQTPIVFYYHIDNKKSISLGVGTLYEFNVAKIEKKYEDPSYIYQNQFGLDLFIGYYYYFTDNFKLRMEAEGDIYTIEQGYFLIKPHLGIIWNFYRGNNK